MRLTLLGTGAADGWPNPFCTCASCIWAREAGVIRGQTAALVNDDLLLDCGPEVPRAAVRQGHSLAGVRHLLLTHAHPDHTGPAALLWRAWAQRRESLDLIGPPAALAACADWIGPNDPVRPIAVAPGDRLRVGPYDVQVLEADHPDGAVLYELDRRLLYATDTGPLPESTLAAVTGARYAAVLMELTGVGGQHLDSDTFPRQLAELRRREAVTESTRVVAVHLGHNNPHGAEFERRLAGWGAEAVADGTVLEVGTSPPRSSVRPPRRILILGGARSGKSTEAERRLAAEPAVTYVATGPAPDLRKDPDWTARVERHRARRPSDWPTVETTDLPPLLRDPPGPLLIDCVTLWLAAHPDDPAAADTLVTAWRDTTGYVVLVSNEVGSGVHPATPVGRSFRDALGTLNARLAAVSDEVWLVTAGIPRRLA
ncbi:MAG: bifunctional adenosylcobinamide kinase/adenosylcobinamide-phosphate guanylyltransferase [Frankiaceae bacterium]